MEVHTKQITKTKEGAEIKATAEEIKPHYEKVYDDFREKVEIKGFRKGKAPLSLIKKMYKEAIESEVISEAVNHFFHQAISEDKVQPVGDPVLKNVELNPEGDFSFSVEYEVLPGFELAEYKGLPIEKPVQKVTDEAVERELEGIRLNHATRTEIDEVSDKYHTLTVDIQELDETGMAIIGKRSQDQTINLFDGRYEKDFVNPLLKAEKDGEYIIKYSHDHGEHKHDVNVKITVKKIEKHNLPELTDEFVKKTFEGKYESIDQLRDAVRAELQSIFATESSRIVRNQIASEIVKQNDFPIPEAIITKVFDQMIEDMKRRMPDQKLPPDFDRNAFEAEYYQHAEWQAKWSILRDKLVEKENITIEDKDLDERAEQDAAKFGIDKERLIGIYKSNSEITDSIAHNKLMDILESHAIITEKEVKPDTVEQQQKSSIIQ